MAFIPLQVTFVFTNQVDGKLVPFESTASPRMQEIKGNQIQYDDKENLGRTSRLFQHHRPQISFSPDGDSVGETLSASLKPLERSAVKRMRTSLKGTANAALQSKLSFGKELPSK